MKQIIRKCKSLKMQYLDWKLSVHKEVISPYGNDIFLQSDN